MTPSYSQIYSMVSFFINFFFWFITSFLFSAWQPFDLINATCRCLLVLVCDHMPYLRILLFFFLESNIDTYFIDYRLIIMRFPNCDRDKFEYKYPHTFVHSRKIAQRWKDWDVYWYLLSILIKLNVYLSLLRRSLYGKEKERQREKE